MWVNQRSRRVAAILCLLCVAVGSLMSVGLMWRGGSPRMGSSAAQRHLQLQRRRRTSSARATAGSRQVANANVTHTHAQSPPPNNGLCHPSTGGHHFEHAVFATTKGNFTVELRPDLAPKSVARLKALIRAGYFENDAVAFFRVNQWITQFGCDEHDARPQFRALRVFEKNDRDTNPCNRSPWSLGTMALIGGNQMVLVLKPNDSMGTNDKDAPVGYVVDGMDVLHSLHRYNDPIDNPKGGPGPEQGKLQAPGGAEYLRTQFPELDYIRSSALLASHD
jgi:peptidylprolyl isomerase